MTWKARHDRPIVKGILPWELENFVAAQVAKFLLALLLVENDGLFCLTPSDADVNRLAGQVDKRGDVTHMMAKPQLLSLGHINLRKSDGCYGFLMLLYLLCQAEKWSSNGPQPRQRLNKLSELAGQPWQFHVPFGPPF